MKLARHSVRLLRNFRALPSSRRKLLLEALYFILMARLALALLPFRIIAASHAKPKIQVRPLDGLIAEVGWAVTRIGGFFSFRNLCLVQALAARRMLRRRSIDSVLHLGVAKGAGDAFSAHAWLDAMGVEVTGYPIDPGFKEIASY